MPIVFAPHITSPKGGEIFNLSKVTISWDKNDQPIEDEYGSTTATSSATTSLISYEIEYTDNYQKEQTNWFTLKRRIPWVETSFEWVVGKMIKSSTVRVRIRARNTADGNHSDWSMSSGDFSINVFKLIPPAIVSPIKQSVYTDFILIILDESLTRNTFHQKVRYTLEYSSQIRSIDWSVIAKDVPVGQNIIRWDLEEISPSDDYVLRLTAKNAATSCLEGQAPTSDQIARRFVYDIKIQQPGMFLIDTQPPQTVLDIENNSGITNQLTHTINVFAEDLTTDVEKIQLRECESSSQIPLGDTADLLIAPVDECKTVAELLSEGSDLGRLIGKPIGFSAKTQWIFEDTSGLRKLEAIVSDSGGNTSVQNLGKTFIPIFRSNNVINDFIIITENRDAIVLSNKSSNCGENEIESSASTFEVSYLVDNQGQYWILEPFPRLITTLDVKDIKLLSNFKNTNYLFPYISETDVGSVYRDDKTSVVKINTFPNALSIPNSIAEFNNTMYMGLANGELWSFNAVSFTLVNTFSNSISAISGDEQFLYIGLNNSSLISLYNGTDFFTSDVES